MLKVNDKYKINTNIKINKTIILLKWILAFLTQASKERSITNKEVETLITKIHKQVNK